VVHRTRPARHAFYCSGAFLESTAENWESEFLEMSAERTHTMKSSSTEAGFAVEWLEFAPEAICPSSPAVSTASSALGHESAEKTIIRTKAIEWPKEEVVPRGGRRPGLACEYGCLLGKNHTAAAFRHSESCRR